MTFVILQQMIGQCARQYRRQHGSEPLQLARP